MTTTPSSVSTGASTAVDGTDAVRIPRSWMGAVISAIVSCGLLVGACSFGPKAVASEDVVLPLPDGYAVAARGAVGCRDDWEWRELVVRTPAASGDSLPALRRHLEGRGFPMTEKSPSNGQWARFTGSTEQVAVELGTIEDYARFGSDVAPNPDIVGAADGRNDVLIRLRPAQRDCMA